MPRAQSRGNKSFLALCDQPRTALGEKKKKSSLEMKSAPSQDRSFSRSINPVSINPQQTISSLRAPEEWREMTNIDHDIRTRLRWGCWYKPFFPAWQIWINGKMYVMLQRRYFHILTVLHKRCDWAHIIQFKGTPTDRVGWFFISAQDCHHTGESIHYTQAVNMGPYHW